MIIPIKIFSDTENRNLEQRPSFSLENLFHGKYTKSYEKFVEDQFVFRNMWIGLKSDSERVLLKNESNGIYLSKNHSLIQSFTKPDDESFNKKIESINQIATIAPNLQKYFLLAPTSVEILYVFSKPFKGPAYKLIE